MSNGTSAGNIITDAAVTYAARTWVDIEKADFYGPISDAQLDGVIGANWFNNVDDSLIALNAWMNGTGEAAHIRAAEATIGTVSFTDLEAASAMIGSGALTDGVSSADDLVIGALEAVDHGLTILSTTVARLAFADASATLTGFVSYTHASDTLSMGVAGAAELDLTSTILAPRANDGLALGTSVLHYSAAHIGTVTAYTSMTIGDATGSPSMTINRDAAGNGDILFAAEGVTGWRMRHAAAGGFSLDRYNGGALVDSVTFGAADGLVTLPGALTVTGDLSLTADTATLTVGSGVSTATLTLDGPNTYLNFKDGGETVFSMGCDGSLTIGRYDGGVYQDGISIDGGTGEVTMPSLTVGSAAASSAIIGLSKDNAGEGRFAYYNEGTARWLWSFDSSEDLHLIRLDSGGNVQGTCTFSNSTGAWSLPNDVTLTGSGRTLTVGDNTGNASITISKTTGGSGNINLLSNAVKRWGILINSSQNLLFERYSAAAALQDTTTVSNSDGSWQFPAGIGVSGQTRRLTSGTGAPAAAATNGDIYWRIDGTISTTFYVRIGGVWTAAVWT